jgi:hypothetical protein
LASLRHKAREQESKRTEGKVEWGKEGGADLSLTKANRDIKRNIEKETEIDTGAETEIVTVTLKSTTQHPSQRPSSHCLRNVEHWLEQTDRQTETWVTWQLSGKL